MTLRQARNWLGVYFLISTVFASLFVMLFGGSAILPMEDDEASSTLQVIIPVFIGQLAVVFKWFATASDAHLANDEMCSLPRWTIILPPVLSITIIVASGVGLYLSNTEDALLQVSPGDFKSAVTLSVSILNASTILLMPRVFPSEK